MLYFYRFYHKINLIINYFCVLLEMLAIQIMDINIINLPSIFSKFKSNQKIKYENHNEVFLLFIFFHYYFATKYPVDFV